MTYHERLLEFGAVRELVAQRCACEMGKRRVAELSPMTDHAMLGHAIGLTREMMALTAERREPPIHELRDVAPHLKKVARERAILDPGELLEVRDFCDVARRMRSFFAPLDSECPGLHALAQPLHHLPALCESIDGKIARDNTVRDSASELLLRLRKEIHSVEQLIQKQLSRMITQFSDSGDLQDGYYTLRNDRYVLPVKSSNRGKVRGIIHDSSNTGETVFIEPFEILEQSNKLADLRLSEREEIYRILLRVAGHVRDELNVLLTNMEILSEFDLICAKARFGTVLHCSFPTLTGNDKPINLVDAHHPLLYAANAEASRPLSLGLDTQDRVLIITGPNAGGKTTALKTVGLTALMVQCAIPAPISPRSRMPVFHHVLADIGDEQSILQGYSTFSAHVRRIAGILGSAEESSLVLLDELGTATDPGEGSALAASILETLAGRECLTLVSTHLGALKNWAHNHPAGRNASFRLSEKDHRPTFRLTLDLPGISEALVIAEQVGLPAEVIERARSLRPESEQDVTGLLLSLQEKEQRLADEIEAGAHLREELESQKLEAEKLEAYLRDEKRKFKLQMQADKKKMLDELRSRIEGMIAHLPSKQELLDARKAVDDELAAVRQEEDALKRELPGRPAREVSPGDRVMVRSLNEVGTVQELIERRGEARVALSRMTVTVKLGELDEAPPEKPSADGGSSGAIRFQRKSDIPLSIDLHGSRVEEGVERLEKFMDDALLSGLSFVRIIHGHGTGALRRGIHEYLRSHPHVKSFRHGTPAEGAGSATIVEFK